jgi:hypothetical protein
MKGRKDGVELKLVPDTFISSGVSDRSGGARSTIEVGPHNDISAGFSEPLINNPSQLNNEVLFDGRDQPITRQLSSV